MNDKIEKILKHYGNENQMLVAIEEMSELTKALTKSMRIDAGVTMHEIEEEIADVQLCLKVLCFIFGIEEKDIDEDIEKKLQRTLRRMDIAKYKEVRKNVG